MPLDNHHPLTTAAAKIKKKLRGEEKKVKCDQWAMTKNRNIDFQTSKKNIDVKNIDIESKTSMFSMFPMSMSHHYLAVVRQNLPGDKVVLSRYIAIYFIRIWSLASNFFR